MARPPVPDAGAPLVAALVELPAVQVECDLTLEKMSINQMSLDREKNSALLTSIYTPASICCSCILLALQQNCLFYDLRD